MLELDDELELLELDMLRLDQVPRLMLLEDEDENE